ncbi:MAG: PEP-CTERM sorting domain-containing protein [Candidatus Brocadiales bacterium]|nr:PEP-CTERM sorting domain-containing protein [Candidatus Brocadiales bacterium]
MKVQTRVNSRRSRKNKLNRELRRELGKKLLGYSAAAGAVLALGTGAAEAAAIKVTNQIDIFPNDIFDLDINSDGFFDLRFNISNTTTTIGNTYFYSYAEVDGGFPFQTTGGENYVANNQIHATAGISYNYAVDLAAGATIDISLFNNTTTPQFSFAVLASRFATGTINNTTGTYGNFLDSRGFLGVRFDIAGNTHFGWVDVEVASQSPFDKLTIYGWGYEDEANTAILAGAGQEAIPEPATLFTLAMGVAGIYAWRRGRRRKSLKDTAQKEY